MRIRNQILKQHIPKAGNCRLTTLLDLSQDHSAGLLLLPFPQSSELRDDERKSHALHPDLKPLRDSLQPRGMHRQAIHPCPNLSDQRRASFFYR